nr:replication associated protein [Flumine microvirus 7]
MYELWDNKGFANYGNVTFESAAYISRYIMAKVTGDLAEHWYTDDETGEQLKPEYNAMSLKPAIGKTWLEKYKTDVYPEGEIQTRNIKTKSPKYYDKLQKKMGSNSL